MGKDQVVYHNKLIPAATKTSNPALTPILSLKLLEHPAFCCIDAPVDVAPSLSADVVLEKGTTVTEVTVTTAPFASVLVKTVIAVVEDMCTVVVVEDVVAEGMDEEEGTMTIIVRDSVWVPVVTVAVVPITSVDILDVLADEEAEEIVVVVLVTGTEAADECATAVLEAAATEGVDVC